MMTKSRGQFITIEGIEGVGKTTSVALIQDQLRQANIEFIATREPGGTPIAEAMRAVLLRQYDEPMLDISELLLLFAARAQHIASVIAPALVAGQWVICDRFTDASYAYQGAGRGIDTDYIAQLEQWVQRGLQPDLTLLLDAPVDIALARAKQRSGSPDRIELEQHAFFERVRSHYLTRAKQYSERYRIISTDKPYTDVSTELQAILQTFIAQHRGR